MTAARSSIVVRAAVLAIAALQIAIGTACRSGVPQPAALDTTNDACGTCRMVVSDARFASQIVAPHEEPVFFDDLGCLAGYLERTTALPRGAMIYVADHRTREWVPAERAVYTRLRDPAAPMGSPIIAHGSTASRDADPDASPGAPVDLRDVFPSGLHGGTR
ncbi:MAG TPA: hypothetical protein VLT86_17570 [Vicinamibacterales bacterium]|nr:hypothetical protein [Vicinamibacterales bacterium]